MIRPRSAALVIPLLWLAAANPAFGQFEQYWIDTSESSVRLASESGIVFDFPLAAGPIFVPFEAQGDPASLGADLRGQIFVDVTIAPPFGSTIRLSGPDAALATPGHSGSWLPGIPDAPSTAAPAQLGVSFDDPVTGFSGSAALRGSSVETSTPIALVMTEQSPGVFSFPDTDAAASWPARSGAVDFETNMPGFQGRFHLDDAAPGFTLPAGGGRFEQLPDGLNRLTLPLDIETHAVGSLFGIALPGEIEIQLEGTLVAYNRLSALPEPSGSLLAAVALLALAALRRVADARS
jgi:hypothetical protein